MPPGVIFNIQRYSIHDGPGIRTTVFFKGCPLRCFWCQNPESQLLHPQICVDNDKCSGCGKCIKACPNGANSFNSRNIASLDRRKCTACGKCVEVCFGEARKVAGKLVSVEEVVAEVLKDVKFYNASGGGVTLY